MTYSLSMPQYWDTALSMVHDTAHKSIAPTRNDQVHLPLHTQQLPHLLTALYLNTKWQSQSKDARYTSNCSE